MGPLSSPTIAALRQDGQNGVRAVGPDSRNGHIGAIMGGRLHLNNGTMQ